MKNRVKITEMQERIEASGIYEALRIKRQLFGEYIQFEENQKHRKEIGFAFLEVVDAVWQLETALDKVIKKSKVWEEKDRISDKEANCRKTLE